MNMKHALQATLCISLAGTAFSGFLTYREFASRATACSPLMPAGTVLGYPPCVYGLGMYLLLVVIAVMGLRSR